MRNEHNLCPICGKPRGAGPYEFAHGACIEIRAQTDGKKSAGMPGSLSRLTVDHVEKARRNRAAKTIKRGDWLKQFEARAGIDYDFDTEAELVSQCQHGESIHMDCERQRPPEIDYAD